MTSNLIQQVQSLGGLELGFKGAKSVGDYLSQEIGINEWIEYHAPPFSAREVFLRDTVRRITPLLISRGYKTSAIVLYLLRVARSRDYSPTKDETADLKAYVKTLVSKYTGD